MTQESINTFWYILISLIFIVDIQNLFVNIQLSWTIIADDHPKSEAFPNSQMPRSHFLRRRAKQGVLAGPAAGPAVCETQWVSETLVKTPYVCEKNLGKIVMNHFVEPMFRQTSCNFTYMSVNI